MLDVEIVLKEFLLVVHCAAAARAQRGTRHVTYRSHRQPYKVLRDTEWSTSETCEKLLGSRGRLLSKSG